MQLFANRIHDGSLIVLRLQKQLLLPVLEQEIGTQQAYPESYFAICTRTGRALPERRKCKFRALQSTDIYTNGCQVEQNTATTHQRHRVQHYRFTSTIFYQLNPPKPKPKAAFSLVHYLWQLHYFYLIGGMRTHRTGWPAHGLKSRQLIWL